MREFVDKTGQKWAVEITIGSVMRVRDKLQIHLLQMDQGTPPLMVQLETDELLLGSVIACLLEPQFEARKVDPANTAAVYELFDGATMTAAADAFWGELTDFFLSRRQTHLVAAMNKKRLLMDAAVLAAERKIDGIDIEQAVSGAMSGEKPESSALTPAP